MLKNIKSEVGCDCYRTTKQNLHKIKLRRKAQNLWYNIFNKKNRKIIIMPIIKSEYIRRKLSYIKSMVEDDTKQKLYDINTSAEYIFMQILNDVYGWSLINANEEKPNFPAIDLIDTVNEIVFQVTSEISTKKVREETIEKFNELVKQDEYKKYAHYKIKMFYIKNKPNFSDKILEEFESKGVPKSHLYGIEDINREVSANPIIATKVFKTLCKILHDKVCDSDTPPNLTTKSSTHDSSFIGREDEVKAIDEMLESSNSLLLINGIGGIGKSSLANHYLYTRENEFDYYGFIDGLDSFISAFRNSLDLKAEKEEELYHEIISKLQGLQGKKLLVIDNVEDIEPHKNLIEMLLSLPKYNYKILFTSRRKIKNVNAYPLGTLLLVDAQKLFLNCFEDEERAKLDKSKVNKIIDYLGLHTLFIKLMAETIKNEGYSLDDIIEKFENGELSKIVFGDEESDDDITFNKILQDLFSMQTLNGRSKLLLKRLAVLPSIDIELSLLEEILGKERLKGRLNFLVGRGWLIENEGSYKLHQIIKEFLLLPENMPYFEEVKYIIDYFLKYERKEEKWITSYLESVVSSCQRCEMKDKKIGNLSRLLGINYYDDLGNKKKSKIYLEYAKKLFIEIGEEVDIDIYHRLGVIDDKPEYLERALSQYEKENNEKQKATCLNDMGVIYWNNKSLDKALSYFEEELKLLKEDNFIHLAINYNQQSLVYKDKRDIEKAFEYQREAINLIEKAIENDDSLQAQFINNLGELHMYKEEFDLALKYIRESLNLREKILYEGHERFGESYDNLAIIEEKRGNFCEAYEYQLKAIEIWEKSPPERDSYLEDAKERLKGLEWKITNPHTP